MQAKYQLARIVIKLIVPIALNQESNLTERTQLLELFHNALARLMKGLEDEDCVTPLREQIESAIQEAIPCLGSLRLTALYEELEKGNSVCAISAARIFACLQQEHRVFRMPSSTDIIEVCALPVSDLLQGRWC